MNVKEPSVCISDEEISNFEDLARKYAQRSVLPMFEGEYPDGNLSFLHGLMDTAFQIGLAATPDASSENNYFGVWGSATADIGIKSSIVILSSIAETCGGIAMCLHAQGVATNIFLKSRNSADKSLLRAGLALQEGMWPPVWETFSSSSNDSGIVLETTFEAKSSSYILNGTKSFVYSLNPPDGYVVFARDEKGWGCFIVPSYAPGILRKDAGARTGLRACQVEHVEFKNVEVPKQARIDYRGNAIKLAKLSMFINWSGMSAIAVGITKGAIKAAKKYATERYQGGTLIENHPIVKSLLSSSDALAKSAEAILSSLTEYTIISDKALARAAGVKLTVMDLCAKAVTDSLQVFGGYGYMEDFGMEKRLREITVLKSASGSPVYLKQLIADIEKENEK